MRDLKLLSLDVKLYVAIGENLLIPITIQAALVCFNIVNFKPSLRSCNYAAVHYKEVRDIKQGLYENRPLLSCP